MIEDRKREWLNKHIWSEQFVEAHILYKEKKFPVRIRYRGGHTREYPKRSYEIRTASQTYHFNAEYDDPSLIRNALSFELFESLQVPSPKTRHCLLYINQERAGVYLQIEAVKLPFFRRRSTPVKSIMYAVNDHADFSDKRAAGLSWFAGYRLIHGREDDRAKLVSFIRGLHDRSGDRLRLHLQSSLDVEAYLRWLCGAVLTGNYDGFKQNYTIFENGGSGLYQMSPWDYEGTWGRNCFGKPVGADLVRVAGYNKLTDKVLSFRDYRQQYKSMLSRYLETVFTIPKQTGSARRHFDLIADEVRRGPVYKWTLQDFQGEMTVIRRYIEDRRNVIASQLYRL
ncbi:spore coat protein CotH [Paenibacillus lemnae]|uniref:Spore coat protein CotH n=2 Tax=Paenibacillus lemnae TaxID=1330551 RepID=A0A848MAG5_PAELE|nr:CotH kinase family protein [Paenibacillus lemnae]NMO97191.1 spore coat protein CotH [Paenibacillus lemnae]